MRRPVAHANSCSRNAATWARTRAPSPRDTADKAAHAAPGRATPRFSAYTPVVRHAPGIFILVLRLIGQTLQQEPAGTLAVGPQPQVGRQLLGLREIRLQAPPQ